MKSEKYRAQMIPNSTSKKTLRHKIRDVHLKLANNVDEEYSKSLNYLQQLSEAVGCVKA